MMMEKSRTVEDHEGRMEDGQYWPGNARDEELSHIFPRLPVPHLARRRRRDEHGDDKAKQQVIQRDGTHPGKNIICTN